MLIEAKAEVPHGQWLPWLKQIDVPIRTAQRYMQLSRVECDTVSHLGIKAALAEISHRRSTLLDALHALNGFSDEIALPLSRAQAETFSDLLACLIRAEHDLLRDDFNLSNEELNDWFTAAIDESGIITHSPVREPAIFQ